MNIRDLFEQCHLDAMGLLDEQERAAFDAAFLAAPPEIRAQLRREQARWVSTDPIACDVEPPEELRDAVIADIGVAAMRPRVLAAVHDEISRAATAPTRPELSLHHTDPAILPVRRVSRVWRATALGFASAAMALGGTTLYMYEKFKFIDGVSHEDQSLTDWLASGTPVGDTIYNRDVRKIVLSPTTPGFKGRAALHVNTDKGTGRLYCHNLVSTPATVYHLYAVDESGEPLLDPSGRPVDLTSKGAITYTGGQQILEVHFNPVTTTRVALFATAADSPEATGHMVMQATLLG